MHVDDPNGRRIIINNYRIVILIYEQNITKRNVFIWNAFDAWIGYFKSASNRQMTIILYFINFLRNTFLYS